MQSIPGEKLQHWNVRYGQGKLPFVVLCDGRGKLLLGEGKVWAPATQAAWPSTAAELSQARVTPQLGNTTIPAIPPVRKLTEPFIVCESDSESSLIIVFSSLEIHRQSGQPPSHICITAQAKESSSKRLLAASQRRHLTGWSQSPETGRTILGVGWHTWGLQLLSPSL